MDMIGGSQRNHIDIGAHYPCSGDPQQTLMPNATATTTGETHRFIAQASQIQGPNIPDLGHHSQKNNEVSERTPLLEFQPPHNHGRGRGEPPGKRKKKGGGSFQREDVTSLYLCPTTSSIELLKNLIIGNQISISTQDYRHQKSKHRPEKESNKINNGDPRKQVGFKMDRQLCTHHQTNLVVATCMSSCVSELTSFILAYLPSLYICGK